MSETELPAKVRRQKSAVPVELQGQLSLPEAEAVKWIVDKMYQLAFAGVVTVPHKHDDTFFPACSHLIEVLTRRWPTQWPVPSDVDRAPRGRVFDNQWHKRDVREFKNRKGGQTL